MCQCLRIAAKGLQAGGLSNPRSKGEGSPFSPSSGVISFGPQCFPFVFCVRRWILLVFFLLGHNVSPLCFVCGGGFFWCFFFLAAMFPLCVSYVVVDSLGVFSSWPQCFPFVFRGGGGFPTCVGGGGSEKVSKQDSCATMRKTAGRMHTRAEACKANARMCLVWLHRYQNHACGLLFKLAIILNVCMPYVRSAFVGSMRLTVADAYN